MDLGTFMLAMLCMAGWGVGSFVSKLATNQIGEKAIFWDVIAYIPIVAIYCFYAFKANLLEAGNKSGIMLGLLGGALGAVGYIVFYILISKKEASSMIPLTALYPALGAMLAIIFLKESITPLKIGGIVLSIIALIMLSI
jgi:transporter family protein